MPFNQSASPFIPSSGNTNHIMRDVLFALVPGTAAYVWFFGYGVLINITLAIIFALSFEALILKLRNRPIKPYLSDYSAVVSAWLFALCIPMHSPWWLVALGIGFAMIAGKHLYGGLGYNPFNPAMIGYVVLLISFPKEMTTWFLPIAVSGESLSFLDSLAVSLMGADIHQWDALTSATPLDSHKTGVGLNLTVSEIHSAPIFGDFGGVGWEWIANLWFLGGMYLLYKGVIKWHIPVAVITGIIFISFIFYAIDPDSSASPGFNLFTGGIMLGAFFIATDPVTASTTVKGRLIFGFFIGVLTYVIRTWGGFPDGVAFAVLLANISVPLIDYYTQPRLYGVDSPDKDQHF
ncbi:MAG: electron transport complex subunit RsxD [Gammaproteobacteria bacterium]|nr:electron transport complex subunit RsxD [Gammaproteobacteria bacterium]